MAKCFSKRLDTEKKKKNTTATTVLKGNNKFFKVLFLVAKLGSESTRKISTKYLY